MAAKKKKAAKKKRASVASNTGNHLDRLPAELFSLVTEQRNLSVRDLISLALTCRRCYEWSIPTAYKKHVKEEHGIAIYWAVQNKRYSTLERLIENDVDINLSQEKVDNEEAYYWEQGFEYESFFDKYKDTHAGLVVHEGSSFTPLALAASLGLHDMVQYLLDRGADIESYCKELCECSSLMNPSPRLPSLPFIADGYYLDESWWTPLHYAICKGHISTTKLLIARGADVDVSGLGSTALHVATRWGQESIIDHLLDNKLVDINAVDVDGATALHIAYVVGNFQLVDKYLDRGADINLAYRCQDQDDGPWTIFAMACAQHRLDKALKYLKRGADPGFILTCSQFGEQWTAMRLIYDDPDSRSAPPTSSTMRKRLMLEQAIFEASGGKPPSRP